MANWNPWHGCHKYSAGCRNCYVYRSDAAHGKDSSLVAKTAAFGLPVAKKRTGDYKLPAGELVWTCFTSDFFLEDADPWRPAAWAMMKERSDLNFLFITKRILRFYDCIPPDWGSGYPNVSICCTAENQACADQRLPFFQTLPVAAKSIICEPLLEEIDLSPYLGSWVKQVVAGGESGPNARLCRYEWVLALRDQCQRAGVPFHFKQTGARFEKDGRLYHIPRRLQHSQAAKAGLNRGRLDSIT